MMRIKGRAAFECLIIGQFSLKVGRDHQIIGSEVIPNKSRIILVTRTTRAARAALKPDCRGGSRIMKYSNSLYDFGWQTRRLDSQAARIWSFQLILADAARHRRRRRRRWKRCTNDTGEKGAEERNIPSATETALHSFTTTRRESRRRRDSRWNLFIPRRPQCAPLRANAKAYSRNGKVEKGRESEVSARVGRK